MPIGVVGNCLKIALYFCYQPYSTLRQDVLPLIGLKVVSFSARPDAPEPLLQALAYAQRFVSEVQYDDLDDAIAVMTRCNAFEEDDNESDLRLRLPSML